MRIVGFGKTRFPIGAFALAMAWAGVPVFAADLSEARARTLSNHDLKGTCVWQSVSVRTDRTGSPAEATMIADAEFDGNGTVVLKHARTNFDGIVVDEEYQGSYQVNSDGDGTITFNFTAPQQTLVYDFQLSRKKHVVRFIRAQDMKPQPLASSSAAIDSRRVSVGVCRMDE